ncbi:hypothetical protein GCM10009760_09200 [Kitasatospora kazusensis]|uniref:Uncharacterized protein n=1 Tax=Kitasatospora kazusensis TaxID=407974 RepID=A0ABN2YXY4_9ACTN
MAVGRYAQQALLNGGGPIGVKEQCQAERSKLTAEQKIAVDRGGFFDGCMNPP